MLGCEAELLGNKARKKAADCEAQLTGKQSSQVVSEVIVSVVKHKEMRSRKKCKTNANTEHKTTKSHFIRLLVFTKSPVPGLFHCLSHGKVIISQWESATWISR